jgi:hypothetical protein
MFARQSTRTRGTPNGTDFIARRALMTAKTGGGAAKAAGFDLIRPIDGTSDDWPTLIPRITANAALGITSILAPGLAGQHFVCQTPSLVWPSNSVVLGTPDTVIDVTLPNTFGEDIAIFHQIFVSTTQVALAADTVPGSRVLHLASGAFANGQRILVVGNGTTPASQVGSTYRIESGGGTTTLELDRPFQYPWTVANEAYAVAVLSQPENIFIDGRGMTMRGAALGMQYFTGALNCHIANVTYDATGQSDVLLGFDYDTFCVACSWTNVAVTNGIGVHDPFSTWGNEDILITHCTVDGTSAQGFVFIDSALVVLDECETTGSQQSGIGFTNSYGAQLATSCWNCRVIGGSYNASTGSGIDVTDYCRNIFIGGGVQCLGNTNEGILIGIVVSGTINGTLIDGVVCDHNANGILVGAGSIGTIIANASTSACSYGIVANTECVIQGHTTLGGNTFAALTTNHTTGFVSVVGFDYTVDGSASAFISAHTGTTSMQGGFVRHTAASDAFELLSGVLELSDTALVGTAPGQGFLFSGATLRLGNGCRFSGYNAGNLFVCFDTGWISPSITDLSSTAPANMFGFTANGATPVAVPFPDLKSTDSIHLERIGGTNTVAAGSPTITKTPGTGFSYVWGVGDASVFNFRILG